MNNRLIELVVTIVVVIAVIYVLSLVLPMTGIPPAFITAIWVIVGVIVLIWLLRMLKT